MAVLAAPSSWALGILGLVRVGVCVVSLILVSLCGCGTHAPLTDLEIQRALFLVDRKIQAAVADPATPITTTQAELEKALEGSTDSASLSRKAVIEELEKARQARIDEENSIQTRTTASLILVPDFETVQPALIQSFSLRTLCQAIYVPSDPPDIARFVRQELVLDPLGQPRTVATPWREGGSTHLMSLQTPELDQLVDEIKNERMRQQLGLCRNDVLSLDFGISLLTLGDSNDRHEQSVDEDFPELLGGLGAHFKGLEFSGGALLYRREDEGDLATRYYIGVSIALFAKAIPIPGGAGER